MAQDLERLVVQLSADITKYERSLARAQQAANQNFAGIERRASQSTQRINAQFSKIGEGFKGFGGLGGNLKGLLALGGAGLGVERVVDFADAWTVAGNKIRAASQISGIAGRSLRELNEIANRSRTGLTETANLYSKLILSAQNLGATEKEIAQVTETVAKSFKAGGASAQEAEAAIIQLTQALASGVLQGDELRSLREFAPLVAQSIAKEFGVTVGKLKELGAAGELQAPRVFKAILKAQKDVDKAFDQTFATVNEGFTLLTNSVTEFIGRINELTGGTTALGEKLSQLANVISNIASIMELIGGATGGKFNKVFKDTVNILAPSLDVIERFLKLLSDPKLVEGIDLFKGRSPAEVRSDIEGIKNTLEALGKVELNDDVAKSIAKNQKLLELLNAELKKTVLAAAEAGAALSEAFDPRASGFKFLKEHTDNLKKLQDVLNERQTEAGRSSAEIELAARAEQILNDKRLEGIGITKEAARAEAERELALIEGVKAREDAEEEAIRLRKEQQELIHDTIAGLQEETAAIQFETEHMSDANSERERARVVFETLNELQSQGITITDELRAAVEREANARGQQVASYDAAAAAAEEFERQQEELIRQQEELNDAFKDSLKGFLSDLAHGKSLTEALTSALDKLADKLIDIGLDSFLGDSGGAGGGTGILGALFGGGAKPFQANTTLTQVLGAGAGAGSLVAGGSGSNVLLGLSKSVATGTVKGYRDAISSIESSGNYSALGPVLKSGDRAYGRYQVMGANIPSWSKEALGQSMTPSAFLSSPAAQDAVFDKKFGEYVERWGESGAANAWFTGSPMGKGKDVLGTSNTEYVQKFNAALGQSTQSLGGVSQAGFAATKGLGDAASGLSNFGSVLSSFMGSAQGGGSGWFQGLASLFGGAGGAFNFMNSISPAATASIIGAGGGFTGLYAGGTASARAGWAVVGENGPELIRLHGGEDIQNNQMTLPRLNRASGGGWGSQNRPAPNVAITVITQDAPSFMRSQNQIANKTASSVDRAYRTT